MRPRGQVAARPLHFIWIIDCSTSMASNGKIQALNNAIRETIPHMQDAANDNPNVNVLVRAVKFSSGANWHIAIPTSIADFRWQDVKAGGLRNMGKALTIVADELKVPPMPARGLPPVLILVTDGKPTDNAENGIQAILNQPWGKRAVRVAIAIGKDADKEVLQKFISNDEIQPLEANNPEALINFIKWSSTTIPKPVASSDTGKKQHTNNYMSLVNANLARGEILMGNRPGGQVAARPLHFIWIADCSTSMASDGKIQALNNAIRETIPHMQDAANDNPNANVLVRAVKFSSGANWHIATPIPIADFKWSDLTASGVTDMGKAFSLVAEQLKVSQMSEHGLPPVLVLVSDGYPTDDVSKGLKAIMDEPWGKRAVRVAIAIGKDADKEVLQKFIGHDEIQPLEANNPEALINFIKWASTAVLKSASLPNIGNTQQINANAQTIVVPVPNNDGSSADDIW